MQQICSGSTSSIILFHRVLRSSTPEEEGLQHFPYIRMAVVLTQHVRRVLLPFDMEEAENAGGDSLSNTMVVQSRASLVENGARNSRAGDNRLVITEHEGGAIDLNTEVA